MLARGTRGRGCLRYPSLYSFPLGETNEKGFAFPGSRRIAGNIWMGLLALFGLWVVRAILRVIGWP